MIDPIEKIIRVPCTPDTAFAIFTRDITKWWPLGVNSVSAMDGKPARAVKLELKEGDSLTEIAHDGTVHHWGSVKVFQPGEHLQLAWHIGTPEENATLVDVHFSPAGSGTEVKLTHTHWERMGDGAADARESYNKGWVGVFEEAYKNAAQAKAA
jgi:uncharacterized protein YndB with AHSA1/START domain